SRWASRARRRLRVPSGSAPGLSDGSLRRACDRRCRETGPLRRLPCLLLKGAGVEEWEELLHPGSLRRTYPTSSHNATPFAHSLPPHHPRAAPTGENPCPAWPHGASGGLSRRVTKVQRGLQAAFLRAALQLRPCAAEPARHTIAAP